MSTTAEALARRVDPDASAEFVRYVAADAELMEIAEADMDAAAHMLIGFALDTLAAYVSAADDTAAEDAA